MIPTYGISFGKFWQSLQSLKALVGPMVAGPKVAALVGLMAAGLKAAALVGLMGMGLKAAALEVAAGPLLLAFELLRGSDSVCPVSESALLKQLSPCERGRPHALLCSIAQRRN